MTTRRVLGWLMLAFGGLELGFVGLVGDVLTEPTFLVWSGGWCFVLCAVGIAQLRDRGIGDT